MNDMPNQRPAPSAGSRRNGPGGLVLTPSEPAIPAFARTRDVPTCGTLNSPLRETMTGRTVSHYEILDRLGEGGMGQIFRAKDTRLNRTVAIKILPSGENADKTALMRFRQEARAASGLSHPNIITVHDILAEEGSDMLVMELVTGQTLSDLVPPGGLPVPQVLKYAVQITSALAAAHAAGIVHRDIKPSNIMVTSTGLVKVL